MANKHMIRHLYLHTVIREMQIKLTVRHFTLTKMDLIKRWTLTSTAEDIEKFKPSNIAVAVYNGPNSWVLLKS